jgi:hypothetical protein
MPGEIVLQTLRHVWQALKPLDIPTAVVGGEVGNWGEPVCRQHGDVTRRAGR